MRLYDDIRIVGMERTMYVLQRALTFVYEDDLLEPKVDFDFGRFKIHYKKNKLNICMEISMIELEYVKLTLEEFALNAKRYVISEYRNAIDELHEVR